MTEFFNGVVHHPPAFPSYTKNAYSNVAFAILGFAYENITGRPLTQGYEDIYQKGLGMLSTTPNHPPPNADAVIPHNDTYAVYSYNLGVQWP